MDSANQIWVCGEALIDLVHGAADSVTAIVGGGPANTAKAISNLGIDTSFIGGISSDKYGELIEAELRDYRVDLSRAIRSHHPTAIAEAKIDQNGIATYRFSLSDTATFEFEEEKLPQGNPGALYIGSLATIVEPGATNLYNWAKTLATLVVFDPNVRPSVLADSDQYRFRFEQWARLANVIKLSIDDLSFLYRDLLDQSSSKEVIEYLLKLGPRLIVLTSGESGLAAFTAESEVAVDSVRIEVADTVGAGDTVGAVLVEGLAKYGLNGLIERELEAVLNRAARAAAITCSRPGARPPTLLELAETF